MKRKLLFFVSALSVAGILAGIVRAQTEPASDVSSTGSDVIKQAQLLYEQGRHPEVTNLLAQIGNTDPNYGQARAWYAMSLYALRDRAQFLVVADTPEIAAADLPEPMRNELVLKQFEVMCAKKQFAMLLPRVTNYIANPPRRENLPLMEEYRLAALYERGMKTVFAAATLPEGDAFNRKYAQGQAQLVEFLKRVVDQGKSEYVLLPDRVLTEEAWLAQAALGLDPELGGDDLATLLLLLKDPEIRESLLPDTVLEDREIKECEKLLRQRTFLELLPKLADYPERHPDSKRLWTVAEYRMAALYERGIKELSDAAISESADSAARRQIDGQNYLREFLNLAAALNETNYVNLPERALQDDIVNAQAALGYDPNVMQSTAAREDAAFHTLQILCRLQPRAVDEHLRRMTNFLNDFPDTKYGQRVRYDVGDAVLEEAWKLIYTEHNRAKATPYLDIAHGLLSSVVEVDEAGVAEADLQEARSGVLRVYYMQRDYIKVSDWAAQIISNSPPQGKNWVVAKLYYAAGLVNQSRLTEAASELDEILTIKFTGRPSYDGHLVSAASWRIRVAQRTGDEATALRVAQYVQNSDCYNARKRTFIMKFRTLLAQQVETVTK